MKHLILAALFFTSQISWGQQGLTTKGQSQSTLEKTERIQLPFSQVTKLSDKSMIFETGSTNLLFDPGFERDVGSSNGWTSDGNMNCVNNNSLTGFIDLYGARWLELELPASTAGYCNSPSVIVPPALAGMPGELKFRTKGGASPSRTITITVYDGAGNILKVGDTYLHGLNSTVYVPFIFPLAATSTTVYYRVAASSASGVMQMAIDDASLGKASGEYNGSVYIPWTNYTPTISAASGALTNYTLSETQWMRDGENVYLKGKLTFTGAVGTWNSPYIPLPSGLNLINPSQIAPIVSEVSLIDTGVQTYAAKLATVSGASTYLSMYIYGGASSASGSITNAIPFSWGSGDIIKWETGPIKITEWIGSGQNVMSLNTLPNTTNWAAWTPTGSWITNTTYYGLWRKNGEMAEYQVRIVLAGAPTSSSLTVNQLHTTDTAKLINTYVYSALPAASGTSQDWSTGSNYNLQPTYNTATSIVALYQNNASGTQGIVSQTSPYLFAVSDTVTLHWSVPIVGWSASVVDMPLVRNSMKTSYAGTKTFISGGFGGATVGSNCTTGSCTLRSYTDPVVLSVTYNSTGNYTLNIPVGTCSSFLSCSTSSVANGSGYGWCSKAGTSATGYIFQCQNAAGAGANSEVDFNCSCNN